MKVNMDAFVAITALLATATVAACSSDEEGSSDDADASAGSGGSTGGSGGTQGRGGSQSTGGSPSTGGSQNTGGTQNTGGSTTGGSGGMTDGGGGTSPDGASPDGASPDGGGGTSSGGTGGTSTGGTGGTILDASSDAPAPDASACLGDTSPGTPACSTLPYGSVTCAAGTGAGGVPVGYRLCSGLYYLRPGIYAALFECLNGISASDPCGQAHHDAAIACFDSVVARACERPLAADGGWGACTIVATSCSPQQAAQCGDTLQAFSQEAMDFIIQPCLVANFADGGGNCDQALDNCTLPTYVTRD